MTMRIASANAQQRSVESMLQRQHALQEAQDRLVSGKRVLRASDDPSAAARVERALSQQARVESSQRALEVSRSAMQQAESAVGAAGDILREVRDLVVEAGNAAYTDSERATLASRIRGLREDLLRVANRTDGAGGFLFAGQGSQGQPFVEAPAGVQFRGNPGQAQAVSGEPLPTAVDGQQAFLGSPTGNGVFVTAAGTPNSGGAWIDPGSVVDPAALTTSDYAIVFSGSGSSLSYTVQKDGSPLGSAQPYTSGQAIVFDGMSMTVKGTPAAGDTFSVVPSTRELSVFDTLQTLAGDLAKPGRTGAQTAQTVSSGLRDLDSSLGNISAMRSGIGTILQRTDEVETRLAESKLRADDERSAAEDLDMVQAVSQLQARQTGYDAALKAYSMVQRLSLFDYLR
jgi:flagellar hook-associated protein 3 FlgL